MLSLNKAANSLFLNFNYKQCRFYYTVLLLVTLQMQAMY